MSASTRVEICSSISWGTASTTLAARASLTSLNGLSQHVHFGDGSTSTEITLEPGEHTLQMLLGDYLHIPHDPPLKSAQITIRVE